MTFPALSPYTLTSCAAAAMLAGCGGSQPPIGAPGALPQTEAPITELVHRLSQLGRASISGDLIYAVPATLKNAFFRRVGEKGQDLKSTMGPLFGRIRRCLRTFLCYNLRLRALRN